VIDTGRGNLLSVRNALEYLGEKPEVCVDPEMLRSAERVVLPGVGAFPEAMQELERRGFPPVLDEVRRAGVPILGICLGMQLLATRSFELGETRGLGWIDADVVRLEPGNLRVPHVGWNDTTIAADSPIFAGLPPGPEFYFVHSYHLRCADPSQVDATCDYGGPVTAAVRVGNVAAVQFHPEKSQDHGLAVLENFLRWEP
jgi:glutamine amidotransferase